MRAEEFDRLDPFQREVIKLLERIIRLLGPLANGE